MKVQVSRDLVEELKKEGKNDNLRYFRSLVHTYYHNQGSYYEVEISDNIITMFDTANRKDNIKMKQ